jgi:glutamyl-tRNA reductase
MEVTVIGVNHKTAPLEIRERLSIPAAHAAEMLRRLEERRVFDERLILSTCNRTEIYGAADDPEESVRRAKHFLGEIADLDPRALEDKLYVLSQPRSVEHLFSVASGLDSMVLGETEIIGQVKDAYERAHRECQTGKVLNALFQRSFRVAKNLRTQTDIGAGRVSVASVAVELAAKIFGSLDAATVMVVGTGEMSTQVAKAMIGKGARALIVSSRHYDRASGLAAELGGEAVPYEGYESRIPDVDVLIASTLAPRALIHAAQVRGWMKARRERPLFLIDIAVPRNIDGACDKLDDVYLYNIDDLKGIAERNLAARESQLEECFRLVRGQTQRYMDWLVKEFGPRAIVRP